MQTKYATQVMLGGIPVNVQLGDIVYYYENAQLDSSPFVGVIISIGENNICNIAVYPQTGIRIPIREGVCAVGDSNLSNAAYRKRGAWAPRMDLGTLATYVNQNLKK